MRALTREYRDKLYAVYLKRKEQGVPLRVIARNLNITPRVLEGIVKKKEGDNYEGKGS